MTISRIVAGIATASAVVIIRYAIHGGLKINPLDISERLKLAAFGVIFRLAVEGIIKGHLELTSMNYTIRQIFTGLNKPQVLYMGMNPEEGNSGGSRGGGSGSRALVPRPGTGQTSGAPVPASSRPVSTGLSVRPGVYTTPQEDR